MTAIVGKMVGRGDDLDLVAIIKDRHGNIVILSTCLVDFVEGRVESEVAISALPHVHGPTVFED